MDAPTFVNSFWGSDGTKLIHTRIKHSINTLKELAEYYSERIQIEKEVNKKLNKLNSKTCIGSHETGSLKVALDKLQIENATMVQNSAKYIKSVSSNHAKVTDFILLYSKTTSKIMHHIDKIVTKKNDAWKRLQDAKEAYRGDCQMYKSLQLCIQTTWGKELERNQAKLSKTVHSMQALKKDYQVCMVEFKDLQELFVRDWSIALQDIYKLEIERIHLCKLDCFGYCNHIATLCVDNDLSADAARTLFAHVFPPTDLQEYAENFGSGNKIAGVPQFVDFMQGYDDDGHIDYSIAQVELPNYQPMLSRETTSKREKTVEDTGKNMWEGSEDAPRRHERQENNTRRHENDASNDIPRRHRSFLSDKSNGHKNDVDKNGLFENRNKRAGIPTLAPPTNAPRTPSPTRTEKPAMGSVYSSSHEDIFEQELKKSDGSNYSNPTNYLLNLERNWASPRRKEKQLQQMQEQINRKSKELPPLRKAVPEQETPIMKDFSIDFIAKALEDLNQGGDGDVSQYRRSVRKARESIVEEEEDDMQERLQKVEESSRKKTEGSRNRDQEYPATLDTFAPRKPRTAPASPKKRILSDKHKSLSDYVDDHDEVATRYESISFKPRPKSMLDFDDTASTVVKSGRRKSEVDERRKSDSKQDDLRYTGYDSRHDGSPRKADFSTKRHSMYSLANSGTIGNLNGLLVTPATRRPYVTKAKARYTYKPQQQGELYFRKGWCMYVIHKQEDNWFLCELAQGSGDSEGLVGLVPGNYIVEGDVF